MNRPFQLIGIGAVACLVIALIVGRRSRELLPVKAEEIAAQAELTPVENAQATVVYESQTQSRVRELSVLEGQQQLRQRAAAETQSERAGLQLAKSREWSALLASNWPAFLTLREQAAHTPTGETPCTLCDGAGYMPLCLLCGDHKGKCVTCDGKGTRLANELCPTCLGNAKCYLCFGTGKMSCPFCNDGTISVRWRMPPTSMPIE
jgi:hypothetical protein